MHSTCYCDRLTNFLSSTGTILLDTACLSVQANRATVKDHDLIASLKRLHPDLQPESVLFQSLLDARSNISNLTSAQLMIKDLKITKQGVPIVGLPILVQVSYWTLITFFLESFNTTKAVRHIVCFRAQCIDLF